MADDEGRPRPPKRDRSVGFRVPQDVYDRAQERAAREKRSLGAILRAWLFFWSEDEAPTPPMLADEDRRAQKTSRKRKGKRKAGE